MKELAYLMFFFFFFYAVNLFITSFTTKKSRKIYVCYPSSSKFNLLWGFLFYAGFAWLTATSFYLKIALSVIILGLSLTLAHNYLLIRCFKKAGHGIYAKVLQHKFSHQQLEDTTYPQEYSPAEITKILGLSSGLANSSQLLSSRLQLFAQIAQNSKFAYANEFYQKICPAKEAK